MHNRLTRLRAARVFLTLLFAGVVALVGAGPADAAPWGAAGADYNGVLCRIGTTDVPMGAWTVNGTVSAYSLADVTGTGAAQGPAPVTGTPTTMTPGQAGFSRADIGTVAYLLARNQGGSAAELAELSTDVALVAGSGQTQSRCLGQNGTSARRAASRLNDARRYAGPYTVRVTAQSGVIPGGNAEIETTVRAASGAATPGIDVSVTAGGSTATATTGRNGVARATVAVPAAAATAVTATAAVPAGLIYIGTSPPSVTAGPTALVQGTTTLRPVLHPKPAVSISADDLVLSGETARPSANVTGTFGYSGNGDITLRGPVQPAGTEPCSSVPAAALDRGPVRWQDTFTFRGDAPYRAQSTPALAPGCYGLRATVTTTNSSPPERATSGLQPLTVATLRLTAAASAAAAGPGGLAATVTGSDPGRASVTTTVTARGPLPVGRAGCTGNFDDAPVAGSSKATTLRAMDGQLRAAIAVPEVRATGCYKLVGRSDISLDGRTATSTGSTGSATTAILRPSVAVMTDAVSGQQGRPMPGTVRVSGTFGFPGVVAVGVVQGATVPITGCRDATFAPGRTPATTTKVATKADTTYPFRTPTTTSNACYSVTATFTLTANPTVTASSGQPTDATVFLAGIRPDAGVGSVVQKTDAQSILRAVITYSAAALLILAAAVALLVRTFHGERSSGRPGPLFRWRPNRDEFDRSAPRRPLPGDGGSRRPLPSPEPR